VWSMNVSMCEGVLRVHVHVSLVFAVSACSETITHRSYCIMRQYNDHTAVDLDGVIFMQWTPDLPEAFAVLGFAFYLQPMVRATRSH